MYGLTPARARRTSLDVLNQVGEYDCYENVCDTGPAQKITWSATPEVALSDKKGNKKAPLPPIGVHLQTLALRKRWCNFIVMSDAIRGAKIVLRREVQRTRQFKMHQTTIDSIK